MANLIWLTQESLASLARSRKNHSLLANRGVFYLLGKPGGGLRHFSQRLQNFACRLDPAQLFNQFIQCQKLILWHSHDLFHGRRDFVIRDFRMHVETSKSVGTLAGRMGTAFRAPIGR